MAWSTQAHGRRAGLMVSLQATAPVPSPLLQTLCGQLTGLRMVSEWGEAEADSARRAVRVLVVADTWCVRVPFCGATLRVTVNVQGTWQCVIDMALTDASLGDVVRHEGARETKTLTPDAVTRTLRACVAHVRARRLPVPWATCSAVRTALADDIERALVTARRRAAAMDKVHNATHAQRDHDAPLDATDRKRERPVSFRCIALHPMRVITPTARAGGSRG